MPAPSSDLIAFTHFEADSEMGSRAEMCPNDETIKLSALDQIMPRTHMNFPLTFTVKPGDLSAALSILQQGFEKLLSEIALLSGHVATSPSRKGEMEIKMIPYSQPELLVRDFSTEDQGFQRKYAPVESEVSGDSLAPILFAQANKVKGGIILCICVHHSVMDGTAMAAIVGRWAKWCHAISENMTMTPFDNAYLDRSPVIRSGRGTEGTLHHPTYHISNVDEDKQGNEQPVPEMPKMRGSCFRMKEEEIARLRDEIITLLNGQRKGMWVSTNDVLCTVLWHAIVRARLGNRPSAEGKCSTLAVPVNLRRRIVPPLPPQFIGNAVLDATIIRPMTELSAWSTHQLADTAMEIRQAVASVDDANIGAFFELVDHVDDVRRIRNRCKSFLGDDLTITSLVDTGLCHMDWGGLLGMIEDRAPIFDGVDGFCIVLPRRRDGSVKVTVGLEVAAMDRLLEHRDFGRYMEKVDVQN
ncbi:MAG: hypothetical protein Q9160_006039 [Pyrenula sp. 1 TL-2023]